MAKVAIPPAGRGVPPHNVVLYVPHPEGSFVRWQLDQNGWAIGYDVAKISEPPKGVGQ